MELVYVARAYLSQLGSYLGLKKENTKLGRAYSRLEKQCNREGMGVMEADPTSQHCEKKVLLKFSVIPGRGTKSKIDLFDASSPEIVKQENVVRAKVRSIAKSLGLEAYVEGPYLMAGDAVAMPVGFQLRNINS